MAKQVVTELKKLDRREIVIPIRGTSPLIVHKFSAKMRQQMLDKQMKKTVVREAKNPQEQYEGSLYTLPVCLGRYGGGIDELLYFRFPFWA